MWKFVVIAIAAYVLYRLFANDFLKRRKEAKARAEKEAATSQDMVKDPECGAYVSKDGSIRVRDGDTVYYFCSYDCRDKFRRGIEEKRKLQQDK